MLFLQLLDREDSSAKVSELGKFLLDSLQPFMPLAVSDLSLCFISASTPILFTQRSKVGDLLAQAPHLFAKDFEVIHTF